MTRGTQFGDFFNLFILKKKKSIYDISYKLHHFLGGKNFRILINSQNICV